VTTSGTLAATVTALNGTALGSTTATGGNLLIGSGTQWVTHALSGSGATFALSSTGVLTVSAIANAALANSTITLTTGTNVGLSTPGAMSLGGTYTLGTTGDHLRVSDLGLGMAAPTGGGQLAQTLGADGLTGTLIKRFSSNTTGLFADYQNQLGTSLWKVAHTGTMTMRPASGANHGIDVNQLGGNAASGATGFAYNAFVVTGDTTITNDGVPTAAHGFTYQYAGAGGGTGTDSGQKMGLQVSTTQTGPYNGPTTVSDTISGDFDIVSAYGKGGTNTGAGAIGTFTAVAMNVFIQSGATNLVGIGGFEVAMHNYPGATYKNRSGGVFVDYGAGGPVGANFDNAVGVASLGGGGWVMGYAFLDYGASPVLATGTLIGTQGAGYTVANGLDFSAYTFTTAFLKGPGFTADGGGFLTIAGNGQATGSPSTASVLGGSILVSDNVPGGNDGGMVLFGAGSVRFGAIKGLLTNGSSNSQGHVSISTRHVVTDSTLTPTLSALASGGVWVGSTITDPGAGTLAADTALGVKDASAAHQVLFKASSSVALTADRTLTYDMGNVAHTLALGGSADTKTFIDPLQSTVTIGGVLSRTRPNEAKSTSAGADTDFSSIFSLPANILTTTSVLRITLDFAFTTLAATPATEAYYLKLGGTKVTGQAATAPNVANKSWTQVIYLYGTAAPGASVAVEVSTVGPGLHSNAGTVNTATVQNLATNGTLAIVPGITWGATGGSDTVTLRNAMVERLN